MRHFGRLLMVTGLVLGAVGCKRARRTPTVNREVVELPEYVPPKLESTPATVQLKDAGKNPRQLLRFALVPGHKETGSLTLDISMQMKEGVENRPLMIFPIIKLVMELEVKEVTPEGDARYEFKFVSNEVIDRGDAPMGALMDYQTRQLIGLGGSVLISSRGVAKSVELQIPDTLEPQAKQLVESIKQSAANFSPPLPEEPVGVGATWVETAVVVADGMKVTKTTNYKIVALEKGKVQLAVTSQHVGDPKGYAPQTPPGMRLELKEYQGTVSGDVTVELGRVLAPSVQKAETVVDVMVSMATEDMSVRTTTKQTMTVGEIVVDGVAPAAPAPGKAKPAGKPAKKAAAVTPTAPLPQ